MTRSIRLGIAAALWFAIGWPAAALAQPCAGDCDGNWSVAVHELVLGVQVGLGMSDMGACDALDVDGDSSCEIDELIRAVDSSMNGCRADCPDCDTDGDGLTDGLEVGVFRTSPLMADTDGDGANDREEVLIGGRSKALVADMPDVELTLEGNPDIVLNIQRLDTVETETARLETNRQQQTNTDTVSNHMAIQNTVTLKTKTEAGTKTWPPSFSAELTTESRFEHGYIHDTSSSFTNESVEETRESSKQWMTERTAWEDGSINATIRVHNRSDLFLKMKDLSLIASRIELDGSLTPIGTIRPTEADRPSWEAGKDIGPSQSVMLVGSAEGIGASMMEKLVRDPTAMAFDVGSYSLFETDASGMTLTRNLFKIAEDVAESTGFITIDTGDGEVNRYYVATNVRRNRYNEPLGVTLAEALAEILDLSYETTLAEGEEEGRPTQVLFRLKGKKAYRCDDPTHPHYGGAALCANPEARGFWLVGGTGEAFEANGHQVDFDDIVLKQGERINLAYLNDTDGDGVFDREEYLLGTDETKPDTDADTLTDYEESKTGLEITVAGEDPYRTRSDPRARDSDGDGLDDDAEYDRGTDPLVADTDGDGRPDATDDDPLVAYQCQSGRGFELMAWWNGRSSPESVDDVWGQSHGVAMGDAAVEALPDGDVVFHFDQSEEDSFIVVPHTPVFTELTQKPGHTVSFWMSWDGHPFGANDRVFLLGKGATFEHATFSIYVDVIAGRRVLSFTQEVRFHRKRWCYGIGGDSCAADDTGYRVYTVSQDITDILVPGRWMHVAARLDKTWHAEVMSICADGRCVTKDPKRQGTYGCGAYYCAEWAIYNALDFPQNNLVIGLYQVPEGNSGQFPGRMDDIQIFGAYLSDELMGEMAARGRRRDFICEPEEMLSD
jgi:hypothetical protein